MKTEVIPIQADPARGPSATVVGTVGAMLSISIFLSGWPNYSMSILNGPKALNYYLLSGTFAAVVAVIGAYRSPHRIERILGEPLAWCLLAYLFVSLLWIQFSPGDPERLAEVWRVRVLALLLFGSVLVLFSSAHGNWMTLSVAAVLVFNVVLYWIDLANPGLVVPFGVDGSNPGRAGGFHINANEAASVLLGSSIFLLPSIPMRFRGLLLVTLFLGVAATFSRSSIILSVLLVVFAMKSKLLNRSQLTVLVSSIPILAFGLALFYAFMLTLSDVNMDDINARLLWFTTGGKEVDFSAGERIAVARAAWEMFVENPVLGHGFAATLRDPMAEPHNTYLMLAAEQGIIGLGMYSVFLYLIISRGAGIVRRSGHDSRRIEQGHALVAMGLFMAIQSLFSHNMLDQPTLFVTLSLLLVMNEYSPSSQGERSST